MRGGVGCDTQESIVALRLPVFRLLGFDDTHKPRRHETSGKHRRIHQDQHVKGIAVLGTGRRHKTEVEGKDRACRQHAFEDERPEARLERKFVRRTLGCLNDDITQPSSKGFNRSSAFGRARRVALWSIC